MVLALCLTAAISMMSIGVIHNDAHAAPSSFTVPEPTPTPTPSPEPTATPSPTSTPEPSSTPSSGSGGRQGSQPSITVQLTIDIFGHQTQWLRTAEGKVLQDIYAAAPDGGIALFIPAGTYAYDADGNPLTEISLILSDPYMKAPYSTFPDGNYALGTYEFWPYGATFSQPINIFIFYNPSNLPKAPDELNFITYALRELSEWYEIPCTLTIDDNMVTISIDSLSTFTLTAIPQDTKGHGSPVIPFLPSDTDNLIFLIFIPPVALLALLIYAIIRRRRRGSASANA